MNTCNGCGQAENEGCKCIDGPKWDGDQQGNSFSTIDGQIDSINKQASLIIAERDELLDLLILCLPYVEEGEEFNKPSGRKLSHKIRDMIYDK
jgi:hypothetical protein